VCFIFITFQKKKNSQELSTKIWNSQPKKISRKPKKIKKYISGKVRRHFFRDKSDQNFGEF